MDLASAFALLLSYRPQQQQPSYRPPAVDNDEVSGITFLQNSTATAGKDGTVKAEVKCYNCNSFGHFSRQCPKPAKEPEVQLLQVAEEYESNFTFLNHTFFQGANIPKTWILLDSQSTVSIFNNRKLVTNIRDSDNALKVHTNGGLQYSTKIATVRNFGDVLFN